MSPRRNPLILLTILLVLMSGCTESSNEFTFSYPLAISGDVENAFLLTHRDLDDNKKEISLAAVLEKAGSQADTIVMVGKDGTVAAVPGDSDFESLHLRLNSEGNWDVATDKYPPAVKIRNLERVIITGDYRALGIITTGRNIDHFTPGEFLLKPLSQYMVKAGHATQKEGDIIYQVTQYKRVGGIRIAEYYPELSKSPLLAISTTGHQVDVQPTSILFVTGNRFSLIDDRGEIILTDVAGIMAEPPSLSITDVSGTVKDSLREDIPVLVIIIDGLGLSQFYLARQQGLVPFLASLADPEVALSVFPPITNAGLAAIMTGVLPHVSGVYERRHREPAVPTIFGWARENGYKVEFLQGAVNPLQVEVTPRLHVGEEGVHPDRQIINTALKACGEDVSLLFVHLKELDQMGHKHGPYNSKTIATLAQIDRDLSKLLAAWSGQVIITADHGMRPVNGEGNHGNFYYEDLIVPYFSIYR